MEVVRRQNAEFEECHFLFTMKAGKERVSEKKCQGGLTLPPSSSLDGPPGHRRRANTHIL